MQLNFWIPGAPVSGNHRHGRTASGVPYSTAEALEYARRVASIAKAACVKANWQMPDYVRMDLEIENIAQDRDNAHKALADALQGIAYANDSRILDGCISRYKDDGPVGIAVTIAAVNGFAYGFVGKPAPARTHARRQKRLPAHVQRAVEGAS